MIRGFLSVGGFTALSRLTGFVRDIFLSAILGAAGAMDAFSFGFRFTNHFRAIFGEGAFNAAYVPTYARALEQRGVGEAQAFANSMFAGLALVQLVLLALAWHFMPAVIGTLAPRFAQSPATFTLAVDLARITFPYLFFITLVTLVTGTLNAHRRFAAGAFAPALLNLAMIACLALAFLFPDAGHAAAWGVFVAGALELAFVVVAAARAGLRVRLAWPRLSADVRHFFKAVVPAVIGSAGVQVAMLADSIIAANLPEGSLSAIYYADRLYQLPVGIIGIAAGTVLLPEMSRRIAAGDPGGALHAQNRGMALTLALATPFFVAFLLLPELIMRGTFERGRFTAADSSAAAGVLLAYSSGLLAIVLIRSAVASFQARGDTRTPMFASLAAVAVNVALKLALYRSNGAAGLAFATAVGAWVNFALLAGLAMRSGFMRPDATLMKVAGAAAAGALALALVVLGAGGAAQRAAAAFGPMRHAAELALVGAAGAAAYGIVVIAALRGLGVRLKRW